MKYFSVTTIASSFLSVAIFFLLTACAPQFQPFKRTASPAVFNDGNHSSQFMTGCPSISVSIAQVGNSPWLQPDGSLMGAVISASVKKSDKNRNDEYLRLLQNEDVQRHARSIALALIDNVISDSHILNINKKCTLICPEKTAVLDKTDIQNWKDCPDLNESLFTMDTRLFYRATDAGVVMDFQLVLNYLDSGNPRKVLFSDIYLSTEITDIFKNPVTINKSAIKTVESAFNKLKPWIKTDLVKRDEWFLAYPLVEVTFKNGYKSKAHKLDETAEEAALRYLDGKIEIVPKVFIENIINSPNA